MSTPNISEGPYRWVNGELWGSKRLIEIWGSKRLIGIMNPSRSPEAEGNAKLLAASWSLYQALSGLFEHCSMVHKHWGEGNNQKEADAAISAGLAALALVNPPTVEPPSLEHPPLRSLSEAQDETDIECSSSSEHSTLKTTLHKVSTLHVEVPANIESEALEELVEEYPTIAGYTSLDETGLLLDANELPGMIESDPVNEDVAALFREVDKVRGDADRIYFHRA